MTERPAPAVRAAVAAAALVSAGILLRAPGLNGFPDQWIWPYQVAKQWSRFDLAFLVALAALVLSGLRWIESGSRRWAAGFMAAFLAATLSSYFIVGPGYQFFPAHLLHRLRPGFFQGLAAYPTLHAYLVHYPEWQQGAIGLAHTHPPGVMVAFWSFAWLPGLLPGGAGVVLAGAEAAGIPRATGFADNTWAGILLYAYLSPLFAMSAVAPVWLAGRNMYGDRGARIAALLFALIPGTLFFIVHLEPAIMMVCAWSLALVTARRRPAVFGGGVAAGVATQLSYSTAGWVFLLGLWLALDALRDSGGDRRRFLSRAAADLALLGAGMAVPWLPFLLYPGFSTVGAFADSMAYHHSVTASRLKGLWVIFNPVDFCLFQNPALVALFVAAVAGSVRSLRRRDWSGLDPTAPALAITLVALDLSLNTSGEVGRIWFFFAPAVVLAAAGRASGLPPRHLAWVTSGAALVFALVILQIFSVS